MSRTTPRGRANASTSESETDVSVSRKSLIKRKQSDVSSDSLPTSFDIAVHAAWFRMGTYTFLVVAILTGVGMTKAYNISKEQGGGRTEDSRWPLLDLSDNPLFNMFGYNNVCIYFDEMPGKYIVVWLIELMIICYIVYVFLSHVCIYLCYTRGIYSKLQLRLFGLCTFAEILFATFFIEIFGSHPKNGVMLHTVPFSCLILTVSLAGIKNVYHDFHTIDFNNAMRCTRVLYIVYGVLLVFFSVWKFYVQFSSLLLHDHPPPEWSQMNDRGWMVLAVLIPWLKAGIQLFFPKVLPRRDQLLCIRISTAFGNDSDFDKCACCTGRIV